MSGRTWTAGAVSRDPRFREYAWRFNAGRFFSAHEVLEELWLEVRGEERDFLQGLVQVAVALEHRARGNAAGAHKVLARARRRLRGYGARHAGLPLSDLLAQAEAYLEGSRPEPPRLPAFARGTAPARPRAGQATKSERTMTRRTTKTKTMAKAARRKKAPPKGGGTRARAVKPARRDAGSRAARTRRAASAKRPAPARSGGAARTAPPARRAAASTSRPRRLSATRAARAARALEPLEVRRERARAILEGLRFLHPDARCELVHTSALELLVATILSAQCTDVRVNMTTPALFARYRTAGDYASANLEELGEIIRSTGFYRNKAKSIVALGKALVERHGGEVPRAMEDLVRLPGVGRKTANVLLAEWYKEPGIAVDTHVIRLTGPVWRLTNEQDPVKIEFALYDLIPEKDRAFFGIATIFHGRRICSARRPNCAGCALSAICPSAFALGPAA
jgi:endonuclease-3